MEERAPTSPAGALLRLAGLSLTHGCGDSAGNQNLSPPLGCFSPGGPCCVSPPCSCHAAPVLDKQPGSLEPLCAWGPCCPAGTMPGAPHLTPPHLSGSCWDPVHHGDGRTGGRSSQVGKASLHPITRKPRGTVSSLCADVPTARPSCSCGGFEPCRTDGCGWGTAPTSDSPLLSPSRRRMHGLHCMVEGVEVSSAECRSFTERAGKSLSSGQMAVLIRANCKRNSHLEIQNKRSGPQLL